MANHIDYQNLLRDKTVALIGGHDTIDWAEVEKADLVVRVNGHWARQGGRCDVLYHSCAIDVDTTLFYSSDFWPQLKFAQLNITHTFFGSDTGRFFWIGNLMNEHKVPWDFFVCAPHKYFDLLVQLKNLPERHVWSRDFAEKYDIYPFTGVMALHHLLLQPIKSLYVDGMDLFEEADKDTQSPGVWHGLHYMQPQVLYLRELKNNPRVTFSTILNNCIFHSWKFDNDT